ncbi:hypothetical protein [Burkholderia cepacia]|uniref:hypothetical protein n=1 Tax=Burkholderia cepacia TaxID=292 RepID=UPI0012D8CE73|nr:hypothetical protein [Burkholderia cepacia]
MKDLEKTVLERLVQATEWLIAHLQGSEGRSDHEIELGLQAIAERAEKDGLIGEGLLLAREMFFDDLHFFTDHPANLKTEILVPFDPPLEIGEYALLWGLYLARAGIACVVDNAPKQHLLGALVFADVIEAQCYWFGTRGLTRCRNPEPRLLNAEQILERRMSESLLQREVSDSARRAANAKHRKPGGSLEKRAQLRAIWASGKYTSRTICAEQECGALGMSFDTARKALRNTPDPT